MLIGLGHRARQGKDVVCSTLLELSQGKAKRYSFAEELKRYCAEHHDALIQKYPHLDLTKKKDDEIYGYVDVLQYVGTEVFRKDDPYYWVNKLKTRIEQEQPELAIIPDVRFPEEAAYVKEQDGALVKVVRITAEGVPYIDPNRDPKHPSECALDNYQGWDFIIMAADGEVNALKESASQLWTMLNEETASPVAAVLDSDESRPLSDEEINRLGQLVR
jgi:hypothetical protein